VLDQSPAQLAQDALVAAREGLEIETVEGDMAKLSMFRASSFDLIVHPVSNCFVPDVRPVWKEAFRVLKKGGALLAGFANPVVYLFDRDAEKPEQLRASNSIPYSDMEDLAPAELATLMSAHEPLEWSHTLEDQLAGQLAAGLVLTDLYEDFHPGSALAHFMPTMIATRAVKPKGKGL
jgi:ubiquinone/menaquinone biosynthesis C-methylase UbiE